MAFVKGQSGNPKGRPKRIATHENLRQSIEQHAPEILAALLEQAKAGDTAAAKLLLDRCIPTLRPSDATVTLPHADTLAGKGEAVIAALSDGELPPDVAAVMMHALQSLAKVIETSELQRRIEALEMKQ